MNPATPSKVQKSLGIIAQFVPISPTEAPAQFVRDLAHRWKERGGLVAGKPRHSDRYLDDLLRTRGTPVRSLIPKLTGRTNLRPADADALVRVFLSHWRYVGNAGSGGTIGASARSYEPLLSNAEIEEVGRYVAEQISKGAAEDRGETESAKVVTQPTPDLNANEFQKCEAMFIVGAGQAVLADHLVGRPQMALIGFRDSVNKLWGNDDADRKRLLVWILDMGRQDIEDPESRLRFMNVEALVTRFKALRRLKDSATESRWNWLVSKSIIVLHDAQSISRAESRLPNFETHHVLFSAIPPRWAELREFRLLYGAERLNEKPHYTIFLRRSAAHPDNAHYELRYFGHALFKSDEKKDVREERGL